MKKHTIDATGKIPGRLATEVAVILMGKDESDFAKNVVADVEVEVHSASKMKFDPKKLKQKYDKRYSGYPGGLTEERMDHVISRKGAEEILRNAVRGMLPKNKLRARMMTRLTIKD